MLQILVGFVGLRRNRSWIVPAMLASAVRQAINNQLRTDTFKGNPTVSLKQSIAMAGKGVDTV